MNVQTLEAKLSRTFSRSRQFGYLLTSTRKSKRWRVEACGILRIAGTQGRVDGRAKMFLYDSESVCT